MDRKFSRGRGQPFKPRPKTVGAPFPFGNMREHDRRSRTQSPLDVIFKTQVDQDSPNPKNEVSIRVSEEVKANPEASIAEEVKVIPEASIAEEVKVIPDASIAEEVKVIPEASTAEEVKVIPDASIAEEVNVIPEASIAEDINASPETNIAPEVSIGVGEEIKVSPEVSIGVGEQIKVSPEVRIGVGEEVKVSSEVSIGAGEEIKVSPEVSTDEHSEKKVEEPTFIWKAKDKLHALPLSERRRAYLSLEDILERLSNKDNEEGKRQRIVSWIETLTRRTPSDDEIYLNPLREYDLGEQRRRDKCQKKNKNSNSKKHRRYRSPSLSPPESRPETRITSPVRHISSTGSGSFHKLPQFAVMGTVIEYVHNNMKSETYIRAVPGGIKTPENFHVILNKNWSELNKLMDALNCFYTRANRSRQLGPLTYEELEPGLLIAVKNNTDQEWHRAVVLKRLIQRDHVQVRLIDFGEIRNEDVFMTRPLLLSFVYALKAQAIRCRIYWGKYYNSKQGGVMKILNHATGIWDSGHGLYFGNMMYERAIAVKIKAGGHDSEGDHAWLVNIHILENNGSNKVETYHLEREFYTFISGQPYIIDDEDETETEIELEFSPLPCFQQFIETKDMKLMYDNVRDVNFN